MPHFLDSSNGALELSVRTTQHGIEADHKPVIETKCEYSFQVLLAISQLALFFGLWVKVILHKGGSSRVVTEVAATLRIRFDGK